MLELLSAIIPSAALQAMRLPTPPAQASGPAPQGTFSSAAVSQGFPQVYGSVTPVIPAASSAPPVPLAFPPPQQLPPLPPQSAANATSHPQFTLATAGPPERPTSSVNRPSPVSHALRQQILAGNYVDLALLIQPSLAAALQPRELLSGTGSTAALAQSQPSRSKNLTPTEFAIAFSIYRDILCAVYADRRAELDDYLSLVLDLAYRFGGTSFYSYHVLFASQAAGRLQQFNQGTFWGALDAELYCRIFAARASLACDLCGAPSHPSSTCAIVMQPDNRAESRNPLFNRLSSAAPPPSIIPQPTTARRLPNAVGSAGGRDRRGRPVLYQGGRMLCNNFNDQGCASSSCRFLHACSFCGGAHARSACPHNPVEVGSGAASKAASTPVKVNSLAAALRNHPDRQFVEFLIEGFTNGFHPGIEVLPEVSYHCKNLLSSLSDPDTVDVLLAKEVQEGFMIGPFRQPPFSTYRVNPIGVATRKYSGKKRLIIDHSSPHGSGTPSINSLIPAPDFSMCYTSIDQAMALIRLAGRGAWLAKADITSAFKVLPIRPEFWRYFGVCWKGSYYFAVRLTFGCRSSPKIFDSLSEALCWILINNYRLPYVLHLLDDFLVVTPPSSPPRFGLSSLITAFDALGVPLSEEKTVGPATSIEFLGITLDSVSFQASLPAEKVHRISLLLSNYISAVCCTKRQLLSLLGHLNYAVRIIPQGKPFLSFLLAKAAAVHSLHDLVVLDASCRTEMRLWKYFLDAWNCVSFFYDDFASHPEDIQLYTDAAPSVGYGGFYQGRWFAAVWPPEMFAMRPDGPSSALFEIYPIVVAALLWGSEWSGRCILIHSDNSAVVEILNKGRTRCPAISQFLQRLTLISAFNQFLIKAAHVPGHSNAIADSLSRFAFQKFRTLAPHSDIHPSPVPPFSATVFL